jgi:hypothetical protein
MCFLGACLYRHAVQVDSGGCSCDSAFAAGAYPDLSALVEHSSDIAGGNKPRLFARNRLADQQ